MLSPTTYFKGKRLQLKKPKIGIKKILSESRLKRAVIEVIPNLITDTSWLLELEVLIYKVIPIVGEKTEGFCSLLTKLKLVIFKE